MVNIHYYAPIRDVMGKEEETVSAETVQDVLKHIHASYGKAALKAAKASLIVVNDVSIGLYQGMKTKLKDNDTVGFLPLCGGG